MYENIDAKQLTDNKSHDSQNSFILMNLILTFGTSNPADKSNKYTSVFGLFFQISSI